MSSFFPKLPRVTGDTDDDVSIHLYNNVGPARPLPKRKSSIYDEEVLKILEEDEDEGEVEEFNKLFKIFKETGKSGLDREVDIGDSDILDYDDETEVEDEDDLAAFKEQINRTYKDREEKKKGSGSGAGTGSKDTPTKSKATTNTRGTTGAPSVAVIKYFLYVLLGIGVALLCAVYFGSEIAPTVPHTGEGGEIRSLSSKLTKLELQADIMSQKQSVLEINQNKLTTSSNEKFEEIVQRFQKIDKSLKNSDNFQRLQAEFLKLNTSVNSVLENSDPNQLETKLNQVTKRLNELSEIGGNVEQLKTDILRRLLDQLPERIPVYIKDKKLHFIPEFHRFLTSFIERYNEDNPIWEREEFKKVIDTGKGGDSSISKGELENYLHAKFASNNKFLWGKLTAFIDELTLNVNSTTPASGNHIFTNGANQILLDNLLTTFAKGSLKINYADYNLGARILGFLTKSSPDDSPSTSFARKIFLGWYDYLSSPKEWNFNANNILIDGGKSWECNSNECSVGIRLFNPIILSDIIVKGIPQELGFFLPHRVSLFTLNQGLNLKLKL